MEERKQSNLLDKHICCNILWLYTGCPKKTVICVQGSFQGVKWPQMIVVLACIPSTTCLNFSLLFLWKDILACKVISNRILTNLSSMVPTGFKYDYLWWDVTMTIWPFLFLGRRNLFCCCQTVPGAELKVKFRCSAKNKLHTFRNKQTISSKKII